jgi:uncharacterized protein YwgA
MGARDFVAMTLLASGGHVRGKTKLQKLVYIVGILTRSLEELGYRPHFYGPYSDDVAAAVTHLKTIGGIEQSVSDWGYNSSGFEIRRYDYTFNDSGRQYAQGLARQNSERGKAIQNAVRIYNQAGDRDYMSLSIAAKTFFLLDHKKAPASDAELTGLAARFGWSVTPDQVRNAVDYLVSLGLVQRVAPTS